MSQLPSLSAELWGLLEKLSSADFEKKIPYMYVDTVGKVTVGIGHNPTAHGDLLRHPFVVKRMSRHSVRGGDCGIPIATNKIVDRRATAIEIKNDYNFLLKHRGLGHFAAEGLAKYTTVELSPTNIKTLFTSDIDEAVETVCDEFGTANFSDYPVTCQAALIDIAFNCGNFSSFKTHFVPAIKGEGPYASKSPSERWKTAAELSKRGAVNAVRNGIVRQWLLQGAVSCAK